MGLQKEIVLGNIDAERDWGYAKEFVEAMWLILQAANPSDYVLATGKSSSIRDFLRLVFEKLDLDWQNFYRLDPRFNRPANPNRLLGDSTKAAKELGWRTSTTLNELAGIMLDDDLR